MRVAFAGSPEPAVPVLDALHASHHDVALVVSQPDRRRGRRGSATPTPVAARALELGIPAIRPKSINGDEALDRLRRADVGALCVAAFGQILREQVLEGWPCINVHFSLLPAYRGAAPVERAIMDGLERSGVTIMQMDAGLDTGPMISSADVPIGPEADAGEMLMRMAATGGGLLVEALDALEADRLVLRPQPEDGVSLAPKISDEDRPLDPERSATELAAHVRALSPHIGAQLEIDGEVFKIWRARATRERARGLEQRDGRLLLSCGDGALEVLELQAPGRARMAAGDFLRGWRGSLELTAS
jgi:methionyl-tRNA formyltransferase